MKNPNSSLGHGASRGEQAVVILAKAFSEAGWKVEHHIEKAKIGASRPELVVKRGQLAYAVEVKVAAEGRIDRVLPLWALACLQAKKAAGSKFRPLAVVVVPSMSSRIADLVFDFAKEHAPDVAVGIADFAGFRRFSGPKLEELNADAKDSSVKQKILHSEVSDLFSDLNQWMLKLLLAPEIPEKLMSAPRYQYRSASHLAEAAQVSVMSASRLIRQLARDGYLHESSAELRLVRRKDLFKRWEAAVSSRRIKEIPMKFLKSGAQEKELHRILQIDKACLGLFAAAEKLNYGFVSGVPPYVYVSDLDKAIKLWKNVVITEPHEAPDIIVREASAPKSLFRGVIQVGGLYVCDIIQIWLDVSSHPSRGKEQADLIRRRVLDPVIKG